MEEFDYSNVAIVEALQLKEVTVAPEVLQDIERSLQARLESLRTVHAIVTKYMPNGAAYVEVENVLYRQALSSLKEKIKRIPLITPAAAQQMLKQIEKNFSEGSNPELERDAIKSWVKDSLNRVGEAPADASRWESYPTLEVNNPQQDSLDDAVGDPYKFFYGRKDVKELVLYILNESLSSGHYEHFVYLDQDFKNESTLKGYTEMEHQAVLTACEKPTWDTILLFSQVDDFHEQSPTVKGLAQKIGEDAFLKAIEAAVEGYGKVLTDDTVEWLYSYLQVSVPNREDETWKIIGLAVEKISPEELTPFLTKRTGPFVDSPKFREMAEDFCDRKPKIFLENYYKLHEKFPSLGYRQLEQAATKEPYTALALLADGLLSENHFLADELRFIALDSYIQSGETSFFHSHHELKQFLPSSDRFLEKVLAFHPEAFLDQNTEDQAPYFFTDVFGALPSWATYAKKAREIVAAKEATVKRVMDQVLGTIPANARTPEGESWRLSDAFRKDPALLHFEKINPNWLPTALTEYARIETSLILIRNLLVQDKPIDEANFRQAYTDLEALRGKMGSMEFFRDRNVLMISNPETWEDVAKAYPEGGVRTGDRFGKAEFQAALREKMGPTGTFQALEPIKNDPENTRETVEKLLKMIPNYPEPLTFIFDGHGDDNGLYFSFKGSAESLDLISTGELAEAFTERAENGHDIAEDILILGSCHGYQFIEKFYKALDVAGVAKPACMTSSEYGQYGAGSSSRSHYGSDFWDHLMASPNPKMGDLWDMKQLPYSNPTIFIPTEGKGGIQLVDHKKESRFKNAA